MSCHVMMSSTANTASGSLRASRTSGGGGVGLLSAGDGRRAASRSRQPQRLVALGAAPSKAVAFLAVYCATRLVPTEQASNIYRCIPTNLISIKGTCT